MFKHFQTFSKIFKNVFSCFLVFINFISVLRLGLCRNGLNTLSGSVFGGDYQFMTEEYIKRSRIFQFF